MAVKIKEFEKDFHYDQLVVLIKNFQDYIARVDDRKKNKPFCSIEDCKKYLDKLINDVSILNGAFYVAEADGKIVGFVQGIINDYKADVFYSLTHKPGAHGWIGEIYVDDNYRNQGIATQLIDNISAFFKQNGCIGLRLHVMASNQNARLVYDKLGFTPRDLEMAIDY